MQSQLQEQVKSMMTKIVLNIKKLIDEEDAIYGSEVPLTKALMKHLRTDGLQVTVGKYPNSNLLCDAIIPMEKGKLWLEVKGAWKRWPGQLKSNGVYRKHLLSPNPKEHSALHDLTDKLPKIQGSENYTGMVIVGFEAKSNSMNNEIAELRQKANIDASWLQSEADWDHPTDSNYQIRCWIWCKQCR